MIMNMNNFGKIATGTLIVGGLTLTIGAAESHANSFEAVSFETTANLNVRNAAGTNGTVVLKTLKKGTVVKVTGYNKDKTWAKIGNGQWVSANYLKLAKATNNTNTAKPNYSKEKIVMRELTVTASSLNVRTGPGTNYPVVSSLKKGANAITNFKSGNWYEIDTNKWVHMDYVNEEICESMNSFYDDLVDIPASDDIETSINSTFDELIDVAPGDEDKTRTVTVPANDVLNVRYTRFLGGNVKDTLANGKQVTEIANLGNVSQIKYINNKGELAVGFVANRYLK